MTHKVHISLDDATLRRIDAVAKREGRTRSGAIREIARWHEERFEASLAKAAAKARALATIRELADADFGADDLPDPEHFAEWRERVWAPRYGADGERLSG